MNNYQPMMDAIEDLAVKFGANFRTSESDDPVKYNAAIRRYTDDRGYMAITRADQPLSGPYSALSFVVFPLKETDNAYTCLVTICIGTSDLGEDEELAALPYLRRAYTKLIPQGYQDRAFIKTSFTDTSTESTALFEVLKEGEDTKGWDISKIERYKKLLPAAIILEFSEKDIKAVENELSTNALPQNDFTILAAWLAQYAKIRGWNYNSKQNGVINRQDNVISTIGKVSNLTETIILGDITNLLNSDNYVVLQGAPGTGKTRAASEIGKKFDKVFFTQFHAETTFADFVGGIRPVLDSTQIAYEYQEGVFTQAVKYALNHSHEKVLLIIDEINRANLANVIGPMFYLLERGAGSRTTKITIPTDVGEINISQLPANLKIIATMNTSDRNLAVVDFALRRRFVWYTMPVLNLKNVPSITFHEDIFIPIADLFDKYATDEELSLQPGHSYFIATCHAHMIHRLKYEIMPLMKEYFANGLLLKARDEFADFYLQQTGEFMYR